MNKKRLFISLSIQDQIVFAQRLAMMMKAGVPITEALSLFAKQANSRSKKIIFSSLLSDVERGKFLAASMAKFRHIFGDFAVNIVEVGESSGTLPENLEYLAEELKKKQALRRKVISSMVYPIFIVIATFGITGLLTIFVFPKILPVFEGFKFPLPWSTRALMFISDIFMNSGFVIIGAIAGVLIVLWQIRKIERVRLVSDRMVIALPLFGRVSTTYHMANYSRTMGLLLKSSVTISRASTIAAHTITNRAYRRELIALSEIIVKGGRISEHMASKPRLFPPIMSQMIVVGENTGKLSDTLFYLTEMYENELDTLTKNMSTMLEPALMVFMGVIVGFIAISIITPIYQVTQYLHP